MCIHVNDGDAFDEVMHLWRMQPYGIIDKIAIDDKSIIFFLMLRAEKPYEVDNINVQCFYLFIYYISVSL